MMKMPFNDREPVNSPDLECRQAAYACQLRDTRKSIFFLNVSEVHATPKFDSLSFLSPIRHLGGIAANQRANDRSLCYYVAILGIFRFYTEQIPRAIKDLNSHNLLAHVFAVFVTRMKRIT